MFTSGSAYAAMLLSGEAGLEYINYDAKVAGKDIFSGSTLAQKYNLGYSLSNFVHRDQAEYYDLKVGYEWADFNTKVTEPDHDTSIRQSSGRFVYGGRLGYNPYNLPVKFSAYLNSNVPVTYSTGLVQNALIGDNLLYAISDTSKGVSSGVTFAFEPEKSRTSTFVRSLPRLYLDYREYETKNSDVTARMDTKTREIAVAGLNRENNWLNYRSVIYEDRLHISEGYTRQQIQIGHVNNVGKRLWASLTNWIDVSADGQLTTLVGKTPNDNYEEYDLNFMAAAKRKTWEATTFMNYNRLFGQSEIKENIRIPVYFKGVYGADTTWYAGVNAQQGREKYWTGKPTETSSLNSITLGGTTFNRTNFVLAPSVNAQTGKSLGGNSFYSMGVNLEAFSTNRFSTAAGVAGKAYWKLKDDGSSDSSRSWIAGLELTGNYHPDMRTFYKMANLTETGNGLGFLDTSSAQAVISSGAPASTPDFMRDRLSASVAWTPTAEFTTSFEGSYDISQVTGRPTTTATTIAYRLSYFKGKSFYRLDSKYESINSGVKKDAFSNQLEAQYLPDIYNEATLRFIQEYDKIYASSAADTYEILQKYSYKMFTRDGVSRNYATITQEYSYKSGGLLGQNASGLTTQYLALSGRYSPTAKLSLTGSMKYEKVDPGMTTLYYSAGINADFKLLVTSLDYTYAKRDFDSRIEKKLAASVKRTF